MYPAVRSRHPLWSWVGCEGGVRRKEVEDVDGEEEEVEARAVFTAQTVE